MLVFVLTLSPFNTKDRSHSLPFYKSLEKTLKVLKRKDPFVFIMDQREKNVEAIMVALSRSIDYQSLSLILKPEM